MEITHEMHEAMIVSERYAHAHKTVSDASQAINECFFIGWTLLTDEEAVILRKAQHALDAIRSRTTSYEAQDYIKSLNTQTTN